MKEVRNVNAARSLIVVVGTLAFGYLSLQLGFKPYLEKAQLTLHQSDSSTDSSTSNAAAAADADASIRDS